MHTPLTTSKTQNPAYSLAVAGGASLLLTMPIIGILGYPFRLLVTIIHELSHGIAGLLTGGSFERFVVFADGSGVAYIRGGWQWLISPAGYLGAAIFAAWLITLGRKQHRAQPVLLVLGGIVLLMTLIYGIPSIFSAHFFGGLLTVVSGAAIGGACIYVGRHRNPFWAGLLLNMIAIQAALMSFKDLRVLVGLSTIDIGAPATDAATMAAVTGLPAVLWAALWAIIAVVLLGWAVWTTWGRALLGRRVHQPGTREIV